MPAAARRVDVGRGGVAVAVAAHVRAVILAGEPEDVGPRVSAAAVAGGARATSEKVNTNAATTNRTSMPDLIARKWGSATGLGRIFVCHGFARVLVASRKARTESVAHATSDNCRWAWSATQRGNTLCYQRSSAGGNEMRLVRLLRCSAVVHDFRGGNQWIWPSRRAD